MNCDLVLVGGGLANSLIAYRLRVLRPELSVVVLERGDTLGGNHTWSLHGDDVSPMQLRWLSPLIEQSWSAYDIRFPSRQRHFCSSYHSITSERLHSVIGPLIGDGLVSGAEIDRVEPQRVVAADGREFTAPAVIDGRGNPGGNALDVRFQKFVGQVVELAEPHSIENPLLMDATVPQRDGYRFIYTLPFDARRLLIEDTRYSDTADLDVPAMREAIGEYAQQQGWSIENVEREETGALPVVLGGSLTRYLADNPDVPRSGLRAGLFHYTTGYSLPEAVRLADDLASIPHLRSSDLATWIRARSFRLWRRGLYFRLLNRMLFLAGPPNERYRIFEHFYRLPPDLVSRFYAGSPTWSDRLKIVSGKPPVPVSGAVQSLFNIRPRTVT